MRGAKEHDSIRGNVQRIHMLDLLCYLTGGIGERFFDDYATQVMADEY